MIVAAWRLDCLTCGILCLPPRWIVLACVTQFLHVTTGRRQKLQKSELTGFLRESGEECLNSITGGFVYWWHELLLSRFTPLKEITHCEISSLGDETQISRNRKDEYNFWEQSQPTSEFVQWVGSKGRKCKFQSIISDRQHMWGLRLMGKRGVSVTISRIQVGVRHVQ